MKKIVIIIAFMNGIVCHMHAQGNTNYGQNSGTSGSYNSYFGYSVGYFAYHGSTHNTGVGYYALLRGGIENTAVGSEALRSGLGCTAVGYQALHRNCIYCGSDQTEVGLYNTGVGYRCLELNVYGDYNTAIGSEALYSNEANANAAFGYRSLYANTSGYQNTAVGIRSLTTNTSGYRNTAIGGYSLNSNLLGNYNTATGYYASYNNNMGIHNTSNGYRALYNNTTGNYNTAHGAYALENSIGGNYNTAIGYDAGATVDLLNNTTAVGYLAVPTASNQVRIGNTSVTSIGGEVEWTAFSDGRFKKDVKENVSGLDFISRLRPVSYVVDKIELNKFLHVADSSSNEAETRSVPERQTGFIAQEVEDLVKKTGYVFSGVDAPENENDPYGIRYAAFVVPLVKGMQELAAKLEAQEQKVAAQQHKIDSLINQLSSTSEGKRLNEDNGGAVLLQNAPNPFTSETQIKMTLPDDVRDASLMIYNLSGKQIKTVLVNDRGEVSVKISGNELSAGMYLYSLIADGKVVDTKRLILTQ